MKRFLLKAAVFFAIQIAIVAWYVPSLWVADPANYMAVLQDKAALLARTDEAGRVILVGGSNTAWGLSAVELGQALHRPVINTGLHAALGLDVMLALPAPYLRQGDVVILSLEFEHYDGDTKHDETIWSSTPYFQNLPVRVASLQPVYIADHFLQYVGAGRDHLVNLRNAKQRTGEDLFVRSSFNARGDMVAHYPLPATAPADEFTFNFQTPDPRYLAGIITELNDFAAAAIARGATVYLYYPPLPAQKSAMYHTELAALDATLQSQLHFPILNHPGQLTLNNGECYNTIYHLTKPGVDKRTNALAAVLQPALDSASPARP